MSGLDTGKIRDMKIYQKIRVRRIRCDDYAITMSGDNLKDVAIATAMCPDTCELIRSLLDNIDELLDAYDSHNGGGA